MQTMMNGEKKWKVKINNKKKTEKKKHDFPIIHLE
jgi:hypothetical protein